jgi:hypothetical protein
VTCAESFNRLLRTAGEPGEQPTESRRARRRRCGLVELGRMTPQTVVERERIPVGPLVELVVEVTERHGERE